MSRPKRDPRVPAAVPAAAISPAWEGQKTKIHPAILGLEGRRLDYKSKAAKVSNSLYGEIKCM